MAAAQLAAIRVATGAIVSIIGRGPEALSITQRIALLVHRLLLNLSHAHPLDVALTVALERTPVIVGELEQLVELDLAHLAGRRAAALRTICGVLGGVSGALIGNRVGGLYDVASAASSISTTADHIESVTTGLLQGERHEASTLSEWDQRAEAAINVVSVREPRLLQCVVNPDRPSVTAGSANVLASGRNVVEVFLGSLQPGTLVG